MSITPRHGGIPLLARNRRAMRLALRVRRMFRRVPGLQHVAWRELATTLGPVLLLAALVVFLVVHYIAPPPPRTLAISTGPVGSTFYRYAERYRAILAQNGVTLRILPSTGSLENLDRVANPRSGVDIAFVQSGLTTTADTRNVVSLGSVFYEPMVVFYNSDDPITRLAQLRGQRIGIGVKGSGTRFLALALLHANRIEPGDGTQFAAIEGDAAVDALIRGDVDAIFLSGDTASPGNLRKLLLAPNTRLFNFKDAAAYVRNFRYLSKLDIPPGTFDLADDLPQHPLTMLAPTVELLARRNLNSAVTDLLIQTARDVNGGGTVLQRPGEFPAPLQHSWPISPEAQRFYTYGRSGVYRYLPFWAANIVSRALVILVPLFVVLLPALPSVSLVYGWRIKGRIYRRYADLMAVERDALEPLSPQRRDALVARLDGVEREIIGTHVPGAYADQLYVLRQHVKFVREQLDRRSPG